MGREHPACPHPSGRCRVYHLYGWCCWRLWGSPPTAYITALVLLQILGEPTHCGDHEVVICEVLSHETVNPSARPLYTGLLRELGKL